MYFVESSAAWSQAVLQTQPTFSKCVEVGSLAQLIGGQKQLLLFLLVNHVNYKIPVCFLCNVMTLYCFYLVRFECRLALTLWRAWASLVLSLTLLVRKAFEASIGFVRSESMRWIRSTMLWVGFIFILGSESDCRSSCGCGWSRTSYVRHRQETSH